MAAWDSIKSGFSRDQNNRVSSGVYVTFIYYGQTRVKSHLALNIVARGAQRSWMNFVCVVCGRQQADCNGSDNELSEQSYVQSRSMRDRPAKHFARCYSLGF